MTYGAEYRSKLRFLSFKSNMEKCLRALTPNRPQKVQQVRCPRTRSAMRSAPPQLSRAEELFLEMDTSKQGVLDLNELRALTTPLISGRAIARMLKHYIVSERSFEITKPRFIQLFEEWSDGSSSDSSSNCQDELNSVWRPPDPPKPPPSHGKENDSILYLIRKMHLLASQQAFHPSS